MSPCLLKKLVNSRFWYWTKSTRMAFPLMPLCYKHSTRFSIAANLQTWKVSVVKKAKRNAQSCKPHNYRNYNSVLIGALDAETRMGTFPRNSTPCKGPESILLGSAFYPRRTRLGVCVSFILKQRWVCTEWKGKRPPRSPKEKSGGIRETSHKVSHSVGPSWVFAFDFSSSVFVLKI